MAAFTRVFNKRRIPLAVVLPLPARGAGTLIPSAQHFVWAAKQPLGNAALGEEGDQVDSSGPFLV